jgi:transposase
MPWKTSSVTEERLRFVARILDGEAMTDVCRDFGISRKTGYKIFHRYREHGLEALTDRSRRPVRYANQLPQQLESLIVRLKGEKPHWGARKIRELLLRRLAGDVGLPAKSTIQRFSTATVWSSVAGAGAIVPKAPRSRPAPRPMHSPSTPRAKRGAPLRASGVDCSARPSRWGIHTKNAR